MEEGQKETPSVTEEKLENVDIAHGPAAEGEGVDKLRAAQEEIEKLKDAWTRERAEFMNFKKRSAQEASRARLYDLARFVGGFLPALDSLDRVCSMQSDVEAVKNFLQGVQMVRQEFNKVLNAHNVKNVVPVNEPFDPRHMEAIAMEEKSGLERETVLEVYEAGYIIEMSETERQVIRPARVKVGRPAPAPAN